jgi:hypothetical protein
MASDVSSAIGGRSTQIVEKGVGAVAKMWPGRWELTWNGAATPGIGVKYSLIN